MEQQSILHQIEQDLDTIDRVLEQNQIDKQQSVGEFVRSQHGEQNAQPDARDDLGAAGFQAEEEKGQLAEEELIRYIQEMIEMMSTEDEALNARNKELLIDQIAQKTKERGVKADRAQIS